MQCHRSRLDALRATLAGMPTEEHEYAGKNNDKLPDDVGLRMLSRMARRSSARSDGRLSLGELIALSHRRSCQRASGTRR